MENCDVPVRPRSQIPRARPGTGENYAREAPLKLRTRGSRELAPGVPHATRASIWAPGEHLGEHLGKGA